MTSRKVCRVADLPGKQLLSQGRSLVTASPCLLSCQLVRSDRSGGEREDDIRRFFGGLKDRGQRHAAAEVLSRP